MKIEDYMRFLEAWAVGDHVRALSIVRQQVKDALDVPHTPESDALHRDFRVPRSEDTQDDVVDGLRARRMGEPDPEHVRIFAKRYDMRKELDAMFDGDKPEPVPADSLDDDPFAG